MAEEYCGGANWWDSSSANNSRTTNRFDGPGGGSATSSTATLANSGGGGGGPGYGWLTESTTTVNINAANSSSSFQDSNKMDTSALQLMGLGLSSQALPDWNHQPILRNPEKAENNFRTMLQEGMGGGLSTNLIQHHQETTGGVMFGSSSSQLQWRPEKLFPSNEDSMESTVTCHAYQLDNSSSASSVYGSPSSILQGVIGASEQHQHHHHHHHNTQHQQNYFGMGVSSDHHHQQQQQQSQFLRALTPYWNASAPAVSMADVRPNNFFSPLQTPPCLPTNLPTFEEKPKTTLDVRDTASMVKKSGPENNTKRARNDAASSTLPPFKVRKEKMGDRITALQQLVSPFGKTDTASVLSEAIEYIKFLHEQVSVLSNPYLKSGASYQQHQGSNEKAKIDPDGPKQDLRSKGLCLVPVSSTFPVTHETTVDLWTPSSFGGTFR